MWTAPRVIRLDEPFVGEERAMLAAFLDRQRQTLLHKCAGLSGEQLAQRSTPPSELSLLGLIRHVTDADRTWFRRRMAGQDVESVYWRADRPDAAFDEADPVDAERDFARLTGEWELCRTAVAELPLDATFAHHRWGAMSLRWVYQHMICEYARHNGHADLLRQRVDGATGA